MMLTVFEVAKRLGMSRTLAYREIQQGRLPHYRFGKKTIRVSEEDLQAFIAASRVADSPRFDKPKPRRSVDQPSQFRHLDVSRLISPGE